MWIFAGPPPRDREQSEQSQILHEKHQAPHSILNAGNIKKFAKQVMWLFAGPHYNLYEFFS